jgi:hypothetical protein
MVESFTVHWFYLALALAMLCFPRQWMRFGKWRKKRRKERETMDKFAQDGARDPNDQSVRLGRELRSLRNYLDFFRGAAGGLALWEFSFTAEPKSWLALSLKIAITVVAVLIQSSRWRQRITWFAAIFFLCGLIIGMGNYVPGSLAFLFVCTLNPIIPTPRLFVASFGLVLLPFGYFLGNDVLLTVISCSIVLLPVLLSLLTQRPMVVFTRKRNLVW